MSAYRSSAEAEIREVVVSRLREARPAARIMHEVNCSLFGPNRIDVMAVSTDEIVSVEIKSERDKLDRLPAQIASMRKMSHHVIAALHEKFSIENEANQWSAHYERDGKFWRRNPPHEAKGADMWLYPTPPSERWVLGQHKPMRANFACLDMLWASEMREFCAMNGLPVKCNASRTDMLPLIRWSCTGQQITTGVCALLRARECIEADAPIERNAA